MLNSKAMIREKELLGSQVIFQLAGFSMLTFAPGFNSLSNPEDVKRYFGEDGFEYVEEGISLK
jgi:hypothetical protein